MPKAPLTRRVLPLVGLVALLLTACDPVEVTSSTNAETTTTTTRPPFTSAPPTTGASTTTTLPPDEGTEEAPCTMGDLPFVSSGDVGTVGEGRGDAAEVVGLRWSTDPRCDRFVVDLATASGSPASTAGRSDVEFRPEQGIVRIDLADQVAVTAVADALVDTGLIDRAFLVRRLDGSLVLDLHLDAPEGAAVRAFAVESPARIVVDIRSGAGNGPISSPPQSDRIVVLEPTEGQVTFPLLIGGYARTADGDVEATLPPFGEVAPFARGETADTATTWGEFAMTLADGPPGVVDLFVGDDADDPDGITISIQRS